MSAPSTAKPSKPGTPTVKDSDKDFIQIKWDPPRTDGGSPITGYDVERKDPKTGKWQKVNRDPIDPDVSTPTLQPIIGSSQF